MKKSFVTFALMLMALGTQAKVVKTLVVTTQPQMHCDGCETKIKGNLRFEKGVKAIECNIDAQRVTITYDGDKTKPETLINAFGKFGYKATEVKEEKSGEAKSEKAPEKKKQ